MRERGRLIERENERARDIEKTSPILPISLCHLSKTNRIQNKHCQRKKKKSEQYYTTTFNISNPGKKYNKSGRARVDLTNHFSSTVKQHSDLTMTSKSFVPWVRLASRARRDFGNTGFNCVLYSFGCCFLFFSFVKSLSYLGFSLLFSAVLYLF